MLKLPYLTIIFVSFAFFLLNESFANRSCSKRDDITCQKTEINKYRKEANSRFKKFAKLVVDARKNYIHCNESNCSCHSDVISKDLSIFKNGITEKLIKNILSKGTLYQIIENKLYRDKDCMFPARCSGIEHFILELLPKLPDIELVINTRDWPQIHKGFGHFGPVFSFSKTSEYNDIMYPAWAFWEGGPAISLYPTGIGRWDNHRNKLGKLGNSTAWTEKIPKAFFRGSRTSTERDALVLLSRENPDLVDAKYTKNQAWKSDADTLHAPPAKEVPFEEHCRYKYLFNFRGVAASFRLKHILLCKSLVFHVGSDWLEFFYPALKPWIHYIPVEANASKETIKELLDFAQNHDEIAQEIAHNGYNMIWKNLRMKDVTCYWKNLLKRYAKLLKFQPIFNKDLIEIKGKKKK